MTGAIASFYASVGVQTDAASLQRVDKYLATLHQKMEKWQKKFTKSINFSAFTVNQKNLNTSLGDALDKASKSVRFEISQFVVNDRNLRAALERSGALLNAGRGTGVVRNAAMLGPGGSRAQDQILAYNLRKQLSEDRFSQQKELLSLKQEMYNQRMNRGLAGSNRDFLHAGGVAGGLARYGFQSLPFIGGAMGLAHLNTANQEAQSARLTTQAVVQAQGMTSEDGVKAFDWLRDLANLNGFNYMDATQDYNQFLSNSLGAGVSMDGSQGIFKGVSEYQTVMGVTPARRKLVNNALSQMMG